MYQKKGASQDTLFIPGTLRDYIPDDHILVRVNRVLDLSWLDDLVKECYNQTQGRPCIEPDKALRLMIAGFLHGIVHDRKLLREAQVNIAFRWFCGYELDDVLPDHSSLTRIRRRWGAGRFRKIFEKVVKQCVGASLVGGEMAHCDASLIRADVSWESLVATYVEKVDQENPEDTEEPKDDDSKSGYNNSEDKNTTKPKGKMKKRSTTDPDASMATSNKKVRLEPTYKQHTAVDDNCGVIVDVEVTTGEINEGVELQHQIERIEKTVGKKPDVVTCDKTYGSGGNYLLLEEQNIKAVIPPQKSRYPKGNMPLCRFSYDSYHDVVRCPAGKTLSKRNRNEYGHFYRAKAKDCQNCRFKGGCIPPSCKSRSVLIVDGYPSLLRARRKKRMGWDDEMVEAYKRHRYQVEGVHGEEKMEHGMARAARRGLWNVQIQIYLTATVVDLKRLADHIGPYFAPILRCIGLFWSRISAMLVHCRWQDGRIGIWIINHAFSL